MSEVQRPLSQLGALGHEIPAIRMVFDFGHWTLDIGQCPSWVFGRPSLRDILPNATASNFVKSLGSAAKGFHLSSVNYRQIGVGCRNVEFSS